MELTEDEQLGKLAYETYYKALGMSPELWSSESAEIQSTWIAVGKAVATYVQQGQAIDEIARISQKAGMYD